MVRVWILAVRGLNARDAWKDGYTSSLNRFRTSRRGRVSTPGGVAMMSEAIEELFAQMPFTVSR